MTMDRRFAGLARLYGVQGAQSIAQAHVAIVGIGGVGSAHDCFAVAADVPALLRVPDADPHARRGALDRHRGFVDLVEGGDIGGYTYIYL